MTMRRDKSFADDLIVHRGVVSSRVALLLRSAETKPLMPRFVPFRNTTCQSNRRPLSVRPSGEVQRRAVPADPVGVLAHSEGPLSYRDIRLLVSRSVVTAKPPSTWVGVRRRRVQPSPAVTASFRVCGTLACGAWDLRSPPSIYCPFTSNGARRQWSPPTFRAERLREKGDGDGTPGSAPTPPHPRRSPHLPQHISHLRDPQSLVRDRNKPTPSIRVSLSPSDRPGNYNPAKCSRQRGTAFARNTKPTSRDACPRHFSPTRVFGP